MKSYTEQYGLYVAPEIGTLSRRILSKKELGGADSTSLMLINPSKRLWAIEKLKKMMGYVPKRPIYYLTDNLEYLPDCTREIAKYASDYVDQLIKHFLPKSKNRKESENASLGTNLKRDAIKKNVPKKLLDNLTLFNRIIYVPAKHEFPLHYEGKFHLFSPKEAVLVCFIVKKLSSKIVKLSRHALSYNVGKDESYSADQYYLNKSRNKSVKLGVYKIENSRDTITVVERLVDLNYDLNYLVVKTSSGERNQIISEHSFLKHLLNFQKPRYSYLHKN